MRYVIEYKPQRVKPIHISRMDGWRVRYRQHPNGWRVIGIAGTAREVVAIADRHCRRTLLADLRRSLLQKNHPIPGGEAPAAETESLLACLPRQSRGWPWVKRIGLLEPAARVSARPGRPMVLQSSPDTVV